MGFVRRNCELRTLGEAPRGSASLDLEIGIYGNAKWRCSCAEVVTLTQSIGFRSCFRNSGVELLSRPPPCACSISLHYRTLPNVPLSGASFHDAGIVLLSCKEMEKGAV